MKNPSRPRVDRRTQTALRKLGARRLEAFLRAAEDGHCLAVRLIVEELDAGATIEDILLQPSAYHACVKKRRGADRYEITFGCSPAPMLGDGGTWDVQFREDGSVEEILSGLHWIS